MVTFSRTIQSKHRPELVFDYLSTFSNAAQWDPGITSGRRLESGAVSKGSKFYLEFNFARRGVELTYEIIEFDRPKRFAVAANGANFLSRDLISVDASDTGSKIIYEATLEFFGIAKFLTPIWAILFHNIGTKAAKGLADWLNRENLSSLSLDVGKMNA